MDSVDERYRAKLRARGIEPPALPRAERRRLRKGAFGRFWRGLRALEAAVSLSQDVRDDEILAVTTVLDALRFGLRSRDPETLAIQRAPRSRLDHLLVA